MEQKRQQFDDQWIVEQLNNISATCAPIPSIERHLVRQNNAIEKHGLGIDALDVKIGKLEIAVERRVSALENAFTRRIEDLENGVDRAEKGWASFIRSLVQIVIGVTIGIGVTALVKALGIA
jgi:hypothetical protein